MYDYESLREQARILCERARTLTEQAGWLRGRYHAISKSPPPPRNTEALRSFILAMNWVAIGVIDQERHNLAGVVCWHQSLHPGGFTKESLALLTRGPRRDRRRGGRSAPSRVRGPGRPRARASRRSE
jgi:hypothetical protein